MRIQGTNNFFNMLNLSNKKFKTREEEEKILKARKDNPVLDKVLYQQDIAKAFEKKSSVEKIAKKIARGESLTAEEMEFIRQNDPEMLRKAQMAKQEKEELERKVKSAQNKQQAQSILAQAGMAALKVAKEVDPQLGNLLMEGVKSVQEEYTKGEKPSNKVQKYQNNQRNFCGLMNDK